MAKTKIKTHRGAAKRFNVTKNGKVKMNKAFRRHILNKKTTKRKRHLRKQAYCSKANAAVIKKLIPYKLMARVKGALNTRKRHKKILKLAKGFRGAESKQFRIANQAVMRSMQNAYVGRKRRKRDFRRLWITRISAACKQNGMNYSTFMNGLKKSGIEMNRKMLSEIAIADSVAFAKLVETAKAAL